MARYVRRANGTHLQIAGGPDDLRLFFRLEGDRIDQFGLAACRAFLELGMTLGNFARLDECIGDMGGELSAAYCDAQRRNGIGAADDVDLRTCAIERPTELDQVR